MIFFGKEFLAVQHTEIEFRLIQPRGRPRDPFYKVGAGPTWPTVEEVRAEVGKVKGLAEILRSKSIGKLHAGGKLANVPIEISMDGAEWEYTIDDVLLEGVQDDAASQALSFVREALSMARSQDSLWAGLLDKAQERFQTAQEWTKSTHKEELDRVQAAHKEELERVKLFYQNALQQQHDLQKAKLEAVEKTLCAAFDSTKISGDTARDKILVDLHNQLLEARKKGESTDGILDSAQKLMGILSGFGGVTKSLTAASESLSKPPAALPPLNP